jgi:hypothetical protein
LKKILQSFLKNGLNTMKKIYGILLLVLVAIGEIQAQVPQIAWVRQYGRFTTNSATVLTIDSVGNSYLGGAYSRNGITFGNITLSGAGSPENNFIAKFDASGNPVWARRVLRIGGFQDVVNPDKIAVDKLGNVYMCGIFLKGATINGTVILGDYGYFLAKLNSAGVVQWVKSFTSLDNINKSHNFIYVNRQQEVCMVGLFNTSITFDANHTLTNSGSQAGVDGFLVKFNAQGELVQKVELGILNPSFNPNGGYDDEYFRVDINDNIYRMAKTNQKFVKYNPNGVPISSKTLDFPSNLFINDMAMDFKGNLFFGGHFSGDISIGGNTIINQSAVNQGTILDGIIVKLDSNYTFQWYKAFQETTTEYYNKIRIDAVGNLYATGLIATALGIIKAVFTKWDNAGQVIWDESIYPNDYPNTTPPTQAGSFTLDNIIPAFNGGNVILIGAYRRYIQFGTSQNLNSNDNVIRIFMTQYGVCDIPKPTISAPQTSFCAGSSVSLTASAAQNYLWSTGETTQTIVVSKPGGYYVSSKQGAECFGQSKTVYLTQLALPNVDFTLKDDTLIANEANATTYQWINCANNQPITGATNRKFRVTKNGNYKLKLSNANGCEATSNCQQVIVCTIPAPIIEATKTQFCVGDSVALTSSVAPSYLWSNGKTTRTIYAKQAGTYYVIAKEIANPDCFAQSNSLEVSLFAKPDSSITQNGDTLIANGQGLSYQWLDCNNNNAPIANATNRKILLKKDGKYALKVTNTNGCTAISACLEVIVLANEDLIDQKSIVMFPNPGQNTLQLKTDKNIDSITIYDLWGKKLLTTPQKEINISSLSAGTYLVKVETPAGTWRGKLIKK